MRAVAFDAMGVLYRSGDDLVELLIPFARINGSRLSDEEIAAVYRSASRGEMTSAEFWRRAGVEGDPGAVEQRYLARYELSPGMVELVDELCGRGLAVGCITNDVAEWSRALRTRFDLDRRITHWTVSGEVGARKPDERIYRAFLSSTGLAPEDVIFVDDRARNVEAAAALGFATLHVDFSGSSFAPGTIRSVDELRTALSAQAPASPSPAGSIRQGRPSVPAGLRPVLDLLPGAVRELRALRGPAGPWLVRYGSSSREAILRWTDPTQQARLGFTSALAVASIEWLHAALRDLDATSDVGPAPVPDLRGDSVAVVDGAVWELLTFVPGRRMSWDDRTYQAGRALARFHEASTALPPRAPRPGTLAFEDCSPAHPDASVAEVRAELEAIGHDAVPRCVIHGDATLSNVVGDDGTWRLIDFAIAFLAPPVADIACALWRTGRVADAATTYDPARIADFVLGYASVRPLGPDAARAIVVYMRARGLQLQHRSELRGSRTDATIIARLQSLGAQRSVLEGAIRAVLR